MGVSFIRGWEVHRAEYLLEDELQVSSVSVWESQVAVKGGARISLTTTRCSDLNGSFVCEHLILLLLIRPPRPGQGRKPNWGLVWNVGNQWRPVWQREIRHRGSGLVRSWGSERGEPPEQQDSIGPFSGNRKQRWNIFTSYWVNWGFTSDKPEVIVER